MIALTIHCSNIYSQNNPQINIKVIGNDTLFVFNRDYAKYVITKFDSLNYYRNILPKYKISLDDCLGLNNKYKDLIDLKEAEIISLNSQIRYCDAIAESYNNSDLLNKQLIKDLKKEKRKYKTWNIIGWTAISTTILSSILIFL